MTIQSIIARAGFPLMVVAGATVFLVGVAISGPEIGAAGVIAFVAMRSLLVIIEGVVLLKFVHDTDRDFGVVRDTRDCA